MKKSQLALFTAVIILSLGCIANIVLTLYLSGSQAIWLQKELEFVANVSIGMSMEECLRANGEPDFLVESGQKWKSDFFDVEIEVDHIAYVYEIDLAIFVLEFSSENECKKIFIYRT
ncbi:MAG: hypothetical protein RLY93_18270 [Sumerlaeia bacterium]